MSAVELSEGQILAGKYRVERMLGSGGMGVVVAAVHIELDHKVAIKVLRSDFASNASVAERFRREARAACKIKSPHGAHVLDVGTTEDGLPYMVMEYLDGNDLAEELERTGCFSVEQAASFVLQAADAIAEAHHSGIIHRDLKPANLFLAARGETKAVKVLDFGISKSLTDTNPQSPALTHTQALIGSPMYMSPEQLDSPRTVDERTDIWSLGVVLYELVSGHPPFMAEGIAGLIKQIVSEEPAPLSSLGIEAPAEFEAIIHKCLAKKRDNRFASVNELAQALAPYASAPMSAYQIAATTRRIGQLPQMELAESTTSPKAVEPSVASLTQAASLPGQNRETVTEWGGGSPPRQRSKVLGRWLWAGGAMTALAAVGAFFMLGPSDISPTDGANAMQPVPENEHTVATPSVRDVTSQHGGSGGVGGEYEGAGAATAPPHVPTVRSLASNPLPSAEGADAEGADAEGPQNAAPNVTASPNAPPGNSVDESVPTAIQPPTKQRPRPSKPKAPASSGDITDFGGRR